MLITTVGYKRRHNITIFQIQFSHMHNLIFTLSTQNLSGTMRKQHLKIKMKPFNTMYIWKSVANVTEISFGIVNN